MWWVSTRHHFNLPHKQRWKCSLQILFFRRRSVSIFTSTGRRVKMVSRKIGTIGHLGFNGTLPVGPRKFAMDHKRHTILNSSSLWTRSTCLTRMTPNQGFWCSSGIVLMRNVPNDTTEEETNDAHVRLQVEVRETLIALEEHQACQIHQSDIESFQAWSVKIGCIWKRASEILIREHYRKELMEISYSDSDEAKTSHSLRRHAWMRNDSRRMRFLPGECVCLGKVAWSARRAVEIPEWKGWYSCIGNSRRCCLSASAELASVRGCCNRYNHFGWITDQDKH